MEKAIKNSSEGHADTPRQKYFMLLREFLASLQENLQVDIAIIVYRISRFITSQIFGEGLGNRCWQHFNLAKSCSI